MKKEKPLSLNVSQGERNEEANDMIDLTHIFHKIVREHDDFMKKENSSNLANANDLYHKYVELSKWAWIVRLTSTLELSGVEFNFFGPFSNKTF